MKKKNLIVFILCLIVASLSLIGCGSKVPRDRVAEQLNKWNEEGKIPTDSFAFAWFECKGWQRFDSIIKLPLNIDRDSIVSEVALGGPFWSSEEIISEGVNFNGGGSTRIFFVMCPTG